MTLAQTVRLRRPPSPCCGEPVGGQSHPTFEELTVCRYSPAHGVLEDEIMVRVQGGLCTACKHPLVRYAEPGEPWEDWLPDDQGAG